MLSGSFRLSGRKASVRLCRQGFNQSLTESHRTAISVSFLPARNLDPEAALKKTGAQKCRLEEYTMYSIRKFTIAVLTAAVALAMTASASFAASEFEGYARQGL